MKNVGKVSFASDVRPLFRSVDIEHMKGMDILLDDYKYMSDATNQYENAKRVYDSLTGKTEPRIEDIVFREWCVHRRNESIECVSVRSSNWSWSQWQH